MAINSRRETDILRRRVPEAIGSAILWAAVVGSGMGDQHLDAGYRFNLT
jgi:hypothetical protein